MEEINTEREPTDAADARYNRTGPIRQGATDEGRAVRQHHQHSHQQDHHIVYPRNDAFSPRNSKRARLIDLNPGSPSAQANQKRPALVSARPGAAPSAAVGAYFLVGRAAHVSDPRRSGDLPQLLWRRAG